jgi:hypothetical protein
MYNDILIAHTCFNKRFSLQSDTKTLLDNFGYNISVSEIIFDDRVQLINGEEIRNVEVSENTRLIIVSDKLFLENPDEIKEILSKVINKNDRIYLFWHQRNGAAFNTFIKERFNEQLCIQRDCMHEEHEPFFKLKYIVESNNQVEFTQYVQELRDEFHSYDDIVEVQYRNHIGTVIYKKLTSNEELTDDDISIGKKIRNNFEMLLEDKENLIRLIRNNQF